jgi:hypothetical protein
MPLFRVIAVRQILVELGQLGQKLGDLRFINTARGHLFAGFIRGDHHGDRRIAEHAALDIGEIGMDLQVEHPGAARGIVRHLVRGAVGRDGPVDQVGFTIHRRRRSRGRG